MLRGKESYSEPLEIYRLARARGMDFVTITDHNSLAGSLAIAHLPGTFLSAEFDTWFPENGCRVHVVASGIDEATFAVAVEARENVYDLVDCLRRAGVTHFLAHPLFDMDGKLTPDIVEKCLLLFGVLEGRNGSRTSRCNGLLREVVAALTPERIEEMAERQGVAPAGATPWRKSLVGGSDDHSGLFGAGAFTAAEGDGTLQGFFDAVARGDCRPEGDDGDARLLAHSIYAAAFWRTREIMRLDDEAPRALGLLRKGFGRIGRDVPVLEKTLRGVRSMAPGLYRDGDGRGPAWEALVDEKLGSLTGTEHGFAGIGARDLNERLFGVISRLADDVQALHLVALRGPGRPLLKRSLQSAFAVALVEFLELPYFIAWSFQSRDRAAQAVMRDWFLGNGAPPRHVAVLADAAGGDGAGAAPFLAGDDLSAGGWVRVLTLAGQDEETPGHVVRFSPLGELSSSGGTLRVPPLLDLLDDLEESGVEAVHVTGPGPMGLVGLAGARLLHLPVSGACGAAHARLLAGARRRSRVQAPLASYLHAFYSRLDTVVAADRATARLLVAAGLDHTRVRIPRPTGPRRTVPDD